MTYKKPFKVFQGTTLTGESINAEDTATSRIGSDAISAFEAHKTIKTEAENRKMLIPFHAVKSARYGVFTEDAERTDPYCGGGTDGDSYTITFDTTQMGGCTIEPMVVPKGESITLPSCGDCKNIVKWSSKVQETVKKEGESYTPIANETLYGCC